MSKVNVGCVVMVKWDDGFGEDGKNESVKGVVVGVSRSHRGKKYQVRMGDTGVVEEVFGDQI